MTFSKRLCQAVQAKGNPVCVGLDPRWESLPAQLRQDILAGSNEADESGNPTTGTLHLQAQAFETFCYGVIDAVSDLVPVVKPQAAFFEQLGPAGMTALGNVIGYARSRGLLVILDGKRNDIGSTAIAYAQGWLGNQSPWQADSLTVSPYLGDDSLEPFAQTARERDCGLFVLVKTSNPGGGFLQDQEFTADGSTQRIYERVAQWVQAESAAGADAHGYGPIGAVVGATYPEQLAAMRQAMPSVWLLVPGYGAQGGGPRDVLGGFDSESLGALINSSRGIIFAHEKPAYADLVAKQGWTAAVRTATQQMIDDLDSVGIRP